MHTIMYFITFLNKYTEIFRHKTSHMVLSIIFLEDKHKMLLHLSIFYEYQQIFFMFVFKKYDRQNHV
jgi:hypothetical protein